MAADLKYIGVCSQNARVFSTIKLWSKSTLPCKDSGGAIKSILDNAEWFNFKFYPEFLAEGTAVEDL
jgi:UDP-glucose 6-dehydrogenase